MPNIVKSYPYLVEKDSSGERLKPVESLEKKFDEKWLQDILRKQPDILPVAEIEPIYSPLIPIGCEVPTNTGSVDNLFISSNGYLVMVETKLWQNPEGKREVLAQAIDYCSSMANWNYEKLNEVVRSYTQKYEKLDAKLFNWISKYKGPIEADEIYFENNVTKNLKLGRFLILIVADKIRRSLIDMLSYVDQYPHLSLNVALVELNCFEMPKKYSDSKWPILVVPSIVAKTDIVERTIVQITITNQGGHEINATKEKVKLPKKGTVAAVLTEDEYWSQLQSKGPGYVKSVKNLIDYYKNNEHTIVDTSTTSLVVRLVIQDTGQLGSLFYVTNSGLIGVWPETFRGQLERSGQDSNLAQEYGDEVRKAMKVGQNYKKLSCYIDKIDLDKFKIVVDKLIDKVMTSNQIV